MNARTTSVVVADDQRVVRDGLALMLDVLDGIDVVGVAADGAEAVQLVSDLQPDVLLVDLRMPGLDGVTATRQVRALASPPAVVVLTTLDDPESILAALQAGALGYLTKDADAHIIGDAIHAAAQGRSLMPAGIQERLLAAVAGAQRRPVESAGPQPVGDRGTAGQVGSGLTAREIEVLALMAAGRSNREIARRLVVSEATVKTHVSHLKVKLGADDRSQMVAYAYQHGLA
ncbi:MAG TPA: response regulator transcription factor [Kribbella sp.]|uniref:response regulator transcription factor n=1 Tax=Kribbella sp. TaxID=1871183 RepID=UPI002D79A8E3|nr:response regulator transcription factor [Kribbella sp.]HET6293128.1 response regulator transcription factor [Kribbella sp.]